MVKLHREEYIQTKIKSSFRKGKILKEDSDCVCLLLVLIDSRWIISSC